MPVSGGPPSASPDGENLAIGGQDGTVRLWDVAKRLPTGQPLSGHTDWVNSVAFSPDGKNLASGGRDGTVRLWHLAITQPIRHTGRATSVQFISGGKILAVGGFRGMAQLWNVAARTPIGKAVGSLSGFSYASALSVDARIFASVGDGWTIRKWDLISGKEIGTPIHTGRVNSVAFSPDGKTLAIGGSNIVIWDVAYLADPVSYLCTATGRSLTPAEWTRWIPLGPSYQTTCP